jgi:hypothetical protein
MELKVGKRYLIARNFGSNCPEIGVDFEVKEIDGEVPKLISEVTVDEISISGKYVKFNTFTRFPVNSNNWEYIDVIDILEELPDRKIKDGEVTQNNVYEKLIEVLTKTSDKKINKRKKCKK